MAGTLKATLERLRDELDDLADDVEELEDENLRLSRENGRLETIIEDADDLPSWDDLEGIALIIRHLLTATGVYDLADLKDAALNAGLEV